MSDEDELPLVIIDDELDVSLVTYDRRQAQATYRIGEATLVVTVPWDPAETQLEVVCRLPNQPRPHRDRFDLAVAAQRRRFAGSACAGTASDPAWLADALSELLDAVRTLISPAPQPRVATADAEAIRQRLTDPALLDDLLADIPEWPGDEPARRLAYLAMTSRLLPQPVALSLGPSPVPGALTAIADCCPPEDRIDATFVSRKALCHDDLRHRLLVLDGAPLKGEAALALRQLIERGALATANRYQDASTGRWRSAFDQIDGPVAVLASEPQPSCLQVSCDASPEQQRRVHQFHCDRVMQAMDPLARERRQRRHHAVQRSLVRLPVVVPFADRITYQPPTIALHQALLSLIQAHALVYQYQRDRYGDAIIATEADFDAIAPLMAALARSDDLTPRSHQVLAALGDVPVGISDLATAFPQYSRYQLRSALRELTALDLVAVAGGTGRRGQRYARIDGAGGLAGAAIPTLAPPNEKRAVNVQWPTARLSPNELRA